MESRKRLVMLSRNPDIDILFPRIAVTSSVQATLPGRERMCVILVVKYWAPG